MSDSQSRERPAAEVAADDDATARERLAAEVELLEAENRRLREQYSDARRSSYRNAAVGMAAVAIVAIAAAFLFPRSQTVLLALGATGLFSAALTYYFTPERFVAATVGERVYRALAANEADLVGALGLQDDQVYVPVDAAAGEVRLFVPHRQDYEVPAADALRSLFVVPDDEDAWGVSFRPTGGGLYREVADTLGSDLAETPEGVADQLADAAVEQFGLAETTSVDTDDGAVSVGVVDDAYDSPAAFDRPVPSLVASGLAATVDGPVTVDLTDGDDRFDYVLTASWEAT